MGRTYKRNLDDGWFDDPTPDGADDDDDLLDWMARPNQVHPDTAGRRMRHPVAGRLAHRGLPDDWWDTDLGDDFPDEIRR